MMRKLLIAVRLAAAATVLAPVCVSHTSVAQTDQPTYGLQYSTYFGGTSWEQARDVFADREGNAYLVGGTDSADFPVTPGAYQQAIGRLGAYSEWDCDAFVAKFDPSGALLWSTYLGGPNYDRAYAVEVDEQGFVYVAGRAGPGFPVTDGAFQTEYCAPLVAGAAGYGVQTGFVSKLSPDGVSLVWSSYVGGSTIVRDMDIDGSGDVYLQFSSGSAGDTTPAWFPGAFADAYQSEVKGGRDTGVVKVTSDGQRAVWATWIGGADDESGAASLRAGEDYSVYLFLNTHSSDMPYTPGAHDGSHNGGGEDTYVARFSSDGSRLLFGTYLGGSGVEWSADTHTIAVDEEGDCYLNVWTASADFPTTPGALDRTLDGAGDIAIVKLSPSGTLLASTFIGGGGNDNSDGIQVDASGNVFLTGSTDSSDFPVTWDTAYQATKGNDNDAVIVVLSADFGRLLYSTFLGGDTYDNGRAGFLGLDRSLYLAGTTNGPGWPTKNAYQGKFAGGAQPRIPAWYSGEAVLAKLVLTTPAEEPPAQQLYLPLCWLHNKG